MADSKWKSDIDPLQPGRNVLVLTRGYHWVGRLVSVSPLRILLADATMFVDVGQIDIACRGEFVGEAHGRQVGTVSLPATGADVIDWPHTLPTKAIGE